MWVFLTLHHGKKNDKFLFGFIFYISYSIQIETE